MSLAAQQGHEAPSAAVLHKLEPAKTRVTLMPMHADTDNDQASNVRCPTSSQPSSLEWFSLQTMKQKIPDMYSTDGCTKYGLHNIGKR
jgi:hypothetical protein